MNAGETIATRKVTHRRDLHFRSLDDLKAEAEHLASTETKVLGNWSEGQIFEHLAKGLKASIDGMDFRAPWWLRFLGPILKPFVLTRPMKPGFVPPKGIADQFRPAERIGKQEGLAMLLREIGRCQQTDERATHSIFGNMTAGEMNQFHLRHAELHLGFIIPVNNG